MDHAVDHFVVLTLQTVILEQDTFVGGAEVEQPDRGIDFGLIPVVDDRGLVEAATAAAPKPNAVVTGRGERWSVDNLTIRIVLDERQVVVVLVVLVKDEEREGSGTVDTVEHLLLQPCAVVGNELRVEHAVAVHVIEHP